MKREHFPDSSDLELENWKYVSTSSSNLWILFLIDYLLIACNPGMQVALHAMSVIETPYCTQELGV
jgi:hypothetical protein